MTGDEFSEIDRRLREAYGEEPVETSGVATGVHQEISRQVRRQRIRRLAVAAAVSALAVGGYWAERPGREPKIFADAARDHRIEVVQKAPRRWRTTDSDVDALTSRFGISLRQIAFPGYQLLHAKICMLDGRRVLHLVYGDSAAEYSLYLTPDGIPIPATERQVGAEHVAGFHTGKTEGLVVGDGPAPDCRRFVNIVTRTAL